MKKQLFLFVFVILNMCFSTRVRSDKSTDASWLIKTTKNRQNIDLTYTLRIFSKNHIWMKICPDNNTDIILNPKGAEWGYEPIINNDNYSIDFKLAYGQVHEIPCKFYYNPFAPGNGPNAWDVDFQIYHLKDSVTPRFTHAARNYANGEIDFVLIPSNTDGQNLLMNRGIYNLWAKQWESSKTIFR